MREKIPKFSPQEEVRSESPEERFRIRALEVLQSKLKELRGDSFKGKNIKPFLDTLLKSPALKSALHEEGIIEPDNLSLSELILRVNDALQALKHRKKVFNAEQSVEKNVIHDPEILRERILGNQRELSDFYRQKNEQGDYVDDEKQKISEALARMDIFGTNFSGIVKVAIHRTGDGAVEVIFEDDVKEVEELRQEAEDIEQCKRRMVAYEEEKNKNTPKKKGGLLKKLFSRDEAKVSDEPSFEDELDGKIMRTAEALSTKVRLYEQKSIEHQLKREQKKAIFEHLLNINGLESFEGDWATLSALLKKESQDYIHILEKSIDQYDDDIRRLEAERRSLEVKE